MGVCLLRAPVVNVFDERPVRRPMALSRTPRAYPANADVRGGSQSVRQLGGVMLKMSKAVELVFQLRQSIRREAALGCGQVERVDPPVDACVADRPVLQDLGLRIRPRNQR